MVQGVNPETNKSYKFKDRTGTRNGRLVFIKVLRVNKHKHTVWEALCDCGNITSTSTPKNTRSCGCIRRENMAAIGQSAKQENPYSRTKEYRSLLRKKLRTKPHHVMQARLSRLHRHALKQVNGIKSSPTFLELGYSVDEFVAHIEKQFIKGMGWHNMEKWQIDHIIPASTAKTKSDVIALNQLSNLRPMWAKDNAKKRASIVTLL
jgi:hypothetical protein